MPHVPAVILVVEAFEDVCDLIESALRGQGYEVVTASSAMEGLSMLETADIDLLITDWMMPGLDGLKLARKVHHESPALPILMISGSGPFDRTLLGSPHVGFLQKPFTLEHLYKAVRAALRAAAELDSPGKEKAAT